MNMATASTPTRSRCPSREENANAHPCRTSNRAASPALNQTVRFPPPDALRLYTSGEARDLSSLTSVARQIAHAHAPFCVPTSQSSSFTRVPSRAEHHADGSPHHSRRPSPSPTRTHSSRSSTRVEPAGEAILQALSRFADQLAAVRRAVRLTAVRAVSNRAALRDAAPRAFAESPELYQPVDHRAASANFKRLSNFATAFSSECAGSSRFHGCASVVFFSVPRAPTRS